RAGHCPGRRGQDDRTTDRIRHFAQPELEARDDAEVAATAPDRPEQIGVRGLVGANVRAVCSDDLRSEELIDRQAELPMQEADTATQRDAADADTRGITQAERQTVLAGRLRDRARRYAAADPGGAPAHIDVDGIERGEVEQDAALRAAVPRDRKSTRLNSSHVKISY